MVFTGTKWCIFSQIIVIINKNLPCTFLQHVFGFILHRKIVKWVFVGNKIENISSYSQDKRIFDHFHKYIGKRGIILYRYINTWTGV